MPYIAPRIRGRIDKNINEVINDLKGFEGNSKSGILNYTITRILMGVIQPKSYDQYNTIAGILSSIDKEIYRRKVAPYEDTKIEMNGDVF